MKKFLFIGIVFIFGGQLFSAAGSKAPAPEQEAQIRYEKENPVIEIPSTNEKFMSWNRFLDLFNNKWEAARLAGITVQIFNKLTPENQLAARLKVVNEGGLEIETVLANISTLPPKKVIALNHTQPAWKTLLSYAENRDIGGNDIVIIREMVDIFRQADADVKFDENNNFEEKSSASEELIINFVNALMLIADNSAVEALCNDSDIDSYIFYLHSLSPIDWQSFTAQLTDTQRTCLESRSNVSRVARLCGALGIKPKKRPIPTTTPIGTIIDDDKKD